jgi:ATP-dependent Lon protease
MLHESLGAAAAKQRKRSSFVTDIKYTQVTRRSVFINLFENESCQKRIDELNPEQKLIIRNFIVDPVRVKFKLKQDEIERKRHALNQMFPNFIAVTDKIFDNLLLTSISKTKGVKFGPLLMVGEPGVGKTYYTSVLTQQLSLPSIASDFSTTSAGFVLTGINSKWGNASVGNIAKLLMTEKVCNGVIVLDELDKARTSFSNAPDPLLSLLSLLEQHSAKMFRDEFLEFTIDAAELNYIATANDISDLPDYLLSRFDVCQISKLNDKDIRKVAKQTYANLLTELEIEDDFSSSLSRSAIAEICNVADVRLLKKVISNAMVLAVRHGRFTVNKGDVKDSISQLPEVKPSKRPIGFLH